MDSGERPATTPSLSPPSLPSPSRQARPVSIPPPLSGSLTLLSSPHPPLCPPCLSLSLIPLLTPFTIPSPPPSLSLSPPPASWPKTDPADGTQVMGAWGGEAAWPAPPTFPATHRLPQRLPPRYLARRCQCACCRRPCKRRRPPLQVTTSQPPSVAPVGPSPPYVAATHVCSVSRAAHALRPRPTRPLADPDSARRCRMWQ